MTQPKDELERFYLKPDPWDYRTTPDDEIRKRHILQAANFLGPYSRALDIGCGEGWVTQDLPASTKHGLELSDNAAARFPPSVTRVLKPEGKYDLVLATGVLYEQYPWRDFVALINEHACKIVITSNIKSWEVPAAWILIKGEQVFEATFPYREYEQKLRVFDASRLQA